MKKKMLFFSLIALFLVFPNLSANALRAWEITSRNECDGKIEIANANSDGSLEHISCHDNYEQAKSTMYNDSREDLVIIENGMIIDAKYAIVDYDQEYSAAETAYANVYTSATSWETNGVYIRSDQPDDAVVLDYDYNTKRVKIKVSGTVGWLAKTNGSNTTYDIIPLAWVKEPQTYTVANNSITHNFPTSAYGGRGCYSITIDIKPSMLNDGTYYSYDGHYFYTNMKTMIRDYKASTYANSVNPTKPYYNYYQYLSFRTKTVYNADNLNQFISSRTGSDSLLYNKGGEFIKNQDKFGTNAALMLAIGINESGWGKSAIAKSTNNLFGLNAVDRTPSQSASYFSSVEQCIEEFAHKWLSFTFLQPGEYGNRFRGSSVGNKLEGLNLRYASDPFWGEKAAAHYYELDKYFDFQERKENNQTIAVLKDNYNGVYAKKSPNGENVNSTYFKYKVIDSPVVVLGEEKDSNGVTWYKVQSDPTLDGNGNYIENSKDSNGNKVEYIWSSYVYVSSEHFRKVTEEVTEYPSNNTQNGENNSNTENNQPKVDTVSTIVTKSGYRKEGNLISGININTDSSTLINALTGKGATNVSITNANGSTKSGKLATGDKITLTGATTETLIIVVSGDTSGDGEVSAVDYVRIKNHIMETSRLSDAYEKAADFNNDGIISASDYVKVKNYIMGQ